MFIIIAFIILAIAAYSDIRTREVPDWLNYGALFAGIGLRLIYSIGLSKWSFIIDGILGLGVGFAIAMIMFYTGQWGGGDSKLLMALGAILGLQLKMDSLFVTFFINLLIVGAVYGLVWIFVLAFKHKKQFVKEFKKEIGLKHVKYTRIFMYAAVLVFIVFYFILKEPLLKLTSAGAAFFIYMMFYLWIGVKSVEKACMHKLIFVSKLTEGDWIVKDVKVRGKKICGPKDLGITKKQIKLLKKHKIKKILIKEGMPFVPSFFIGFVISLLWGNWWVYFI